MVNGKRRVAFKTVGCRLNQAETAQMSAQFGAAGYRVVPFGEPSDICIIHTCTVTHKAEKECVRLARSIKRTNDNTFVVLAGCAVEAGNANILQQSGADIFAGQEEKFRLPEIISEFRVPASAEEASADRQGSEFRNVASFVAAGVDRGAGPTPACGGVNSALAPHSAGRPATQDGQKIRVIPQFQTTRALVKVQDGCDFGCAYCIVPFARGRARSRPFVEIVDEVRKLADHGYREVVLTGANMGCYKDGSRGLVHLLERIEAIQRIDRIRLSSIEVSTTERAIIDHMAESSKLCRYIHIPLQSGDDRILSAMGRRYTAQEYRRLIEYAVKKIPLLGLGTDLLAGLPGEDKAAFANTVRMVKDLPFSNLHVFPYSKRPGTTAASMPKQVHDHEKKRRTALLIELGKKMKQSFAEKFIGRKVSVLVERITPSTGSPRLNSGQAGQAGDGSGTGWTAEYLEAEVTGRNLKTNQIVEFRPARYDAGVLR